MFLPGFGFCFSNQNRRDQNTNQSCQKNKTGRLEKSLFRVGLDHLQNLLVNLHLQSKWSEFNLLAKLLSCP